MTTRSDIAIAGGDEIYLLQVILIWCAYLRELWIISVFIFIH
jgi:hypothetical protein